VAVLDTYKVFEALMGAGFTESQAKALINAGREGYGALATKTDIQDMATKTDIQDMATKTDLRELEQRMTIKVGAMLFTLAGLLVAVLVALELLPL
jgi:predicted DNA binding protein